MKSPAMDLAKQARVMAASSKCLEALAPLSPDERHRVMFGLVIATIDVEGENGRLAIENLLSKMTEEMKR